jgi:hypothetical protein
MVDPIQRSKRRSAGKQARRAPPLKNFTLYLDESFDCAEVKADLTAARIKFKVYSESFRQGEADSKILEHAGRRGWAVLTCDKKNRFREVERQAVLRYRVRLFVFSGNLGGPALAKLLVSVYPAMRHFSRKNERPFVAVITVGGHISLRMDKNGGYITRGER